MHSVTGSSVTGWTQSGSTCTLKVNANMFPEVSRTTTSTEEEAKDTAVTPEYVDTLLHCVVSACVPLPVQTHEASADAALVKSARMN